MVDRLETAFDVANDYAPEHLLLRDPRAAPLARPTCSAAGAVFLGHWSPESMGDYCSGPNHTLPTYGYARAYSGLSLEDFQKRITVQELTPAGLAADLRTARQRSWPHLEGLDAHAAAVDRAARGARREPPAERRGCRWRARRSSTLKAYAHAAWLPSL